MAATKGSVRATGADAKAPAKRTLPPVTVARFEASLELVERIASEERAGFLREMQDFRAEHRSVTRRPLSAEEATRFAAAMADAYQDESPDQVAGRLQSSDLHAWEDPAPREVLVAAGMATAPALVRAVRRFVALMEMDEDAFVDAYESDTLADVVDAAAKAPALVHARLPEGRARTVAAFEHWGKQAGVASGEVMRRLIETVMGALEQAAARSMATASPALSHLSTGSPEPTAGQGEPSSTTPDTSTP